MFRSNFANTILGILAVVLTSGCGTVLSYRDCETPGAFGGIKRNLDVIDYNTNIKNPRMLPGLTVLMGSIDLPLSLVGDILMLPYVLWATSEERSIESTRHDSPPNP